MVYLNKLRDRPQISWLISSEMNIDTKKEMRDIYIYIETKLFHNP